MHKKIKEAIKYFFRKNFGYDLRTLRIKLTEDFLDQNKILENRPVNVIFDVGTNVGQTTLKYKKMFPRTQIYGFEPFLDVFQKYINFYKGDKKILGINKALSNKDGKANFFVNNNYYTNSLLPISERQKNDADFGLKSKTEVATGTVDSFCKKNNINHIDILKMDVQGGEMLVLEGAKTMLEKGAIDLIYSEVEFVEIYEDQPLFKDIQIFLGQYGYYLYKKYIVDDDKNGNPVAGDAIFVNHRLYYHSQYGQDKFLDQKIFKGMMGGIFVEAGADNGINGSNTLFFEKERNWSGLCIEPRNSVYGELVKNRSCKTANLAISSDKSKNKKFLEIEGSLGQLSGFIDATDQRHAKRVEEETSEQNLKTSVIDVSTDTLNKILENNDMGHIDYLSLDTEGGELDILKSIDYRRFPVNCISVENKYEEKEIYRFLSSVGYRKIARLKIDDIFVLKNSPFDCYREPWGQKINHHILNWKKIVKKIIGYD